MENNHQFVFRIIFIFLLIIAFCDVVTGHCKAEQTDTNTENFQTSYQFVSHEAQLMKPEELRSFEGLAGLTTRQCEAYISAMQLFCNITYKSFAHQKQIVQ